MTVAPPSPPFIQARHYRDANITPVAICMHGTVSHDDPGTARQIARMFATMDRVASAHYVRDPRETIQCVGDHDVAFHCGHNSGVIGYELCDEQAGPANRWFDEDSTAILKGAAKDVARLCAAYSIEPRRPSVAELKAKGPHGIYGHNDSRLAFGNTTHTDPRDFPWDYFLKLVKAEYDLLLGKAPERVTPPAAAKIVTGVRIAEISSRFDRSPASLLADVEAAAEWADIILLTEVTRFGRRKTLHDFAKREGWTRHQDIDSGDASEVAILTRDSKWQAHGFKAQVLGPDLGPGGRIIGGIACLVHKNGTRFVVSVSHLPASVEGAWGSTRARAYRAAVRQLRDAHAAARRQLNPHAEAAFGDWNLNLHKTWVREWIAKAWPTLTVPRASVIPKGGTHAGGRLIDWFVRRNLYITAWRVMPASEGSDHRSIRVAGHINRKA